MEPLSLNGPPIFHDPTWRRWLIAIGVVWVALAIIYAFMAIQTRKKEQRLTGNGVSMIRDFSKQAGVPLLDQDIKKLRSMLVDIGRQPGVLYASVVDHKNKIIAYTDAGQLLPPRKESVSDQSGVETWLDEEAMVFSNDIMFSETSIGEIRLALSRTSIVRSEKVFNVIVAISLTGLVMAALFMHGRKLVGFAAQWRGKTKPHIDGQLLYCPLCGQGVNDDGSFCHAADKDIVFRLSGALPGREGLTGVGLAEIGSNPGLASIKGQMIQQCAEIIRKLSVNDGCSGKQVRENIR